MLLWAIWLPGKLTQESNGRFDASLKSCGKDGGVRGFEAVGPLAVSQCTEHRCDIVRCLQITETWCERYRTVEIKPEK